MTNSNWDNGTIILYVITILFASVTAFCSYKKSIYTSDSDTLHLVREARLSRFGFVVTFLILWQLLAFSTCGKDYESYNHLFLSALDWDYIIGHHELEIGFACLNFIIRILTDSVNVYNGILAFIFLYLIFSTLYKLKNRIHFGWAVLAFSCIFFLQFMNLKRIYLAAAICFYGIPYLLNNQKFRSLFTVLIAAAVHTSAIVMLLPLVIFWVFSKKFKWWQLTMMAVLGILVVYVFRHQIVEISFSSRYDKYGIQESGFGLAQIVYHVPIIWLLVKNRRQQKEFLTRLGLVYILCSAAVSIMGYFIVAIGRMFSYFILPFVLAPSVLYVGNSQKSIIRHGVVRKEHFAYLIALVYFVFRLYMYCSTMLFTDGLMPYTSIFS